MGVFDFWRQPGLDVGAPALTTAIEEAQFLAVDIETTGFHPKKDHIVSIGWVPLTVSGIDLAGAGYRVVRGVEVGQSATIHMLTDADVAAGVELTDAIEDVLAQIHGKVLLAHFASLETGFLSAACTRLRGSAPNWVVVDTFALERRHMEKMATYPRGEDLRLARVRSRYGLPAYGNHNALTDALACAELFLALHAHGRARILRDLVKVS